MVTYSWKDMERFTDSARTILVVRLVPSCAGRLMTARGNAAPRFLVYYYNTKFPPKLMSIIQNHFNNR